MNCRTAACCAAGLLATFHCAWATTAAPKTQTVWQAGAANVPAGQSYAASFDIGLFYNPAIETVTNASLTLAFVGSGQRNATPRDVLTVHNQNGTTDTYTVYDDALDSVRIALGVNGGQTAQANDLAGLGSWTSPATSSTPFYGTYQQCSGTFVVSCYPVSYLIGYNQSYDRVDGYRGAFTFTGALDATSLAALAANGTLRYGYTVGSGGAGLEAAMLTFTTAPVPEPTSASLGLVGAAAMMAWLRGRRRGRSHQRAASHAHGIAARPTP